MLKSGDLTSEELVACHIDHIRRYDVDRLISVLSLNQDALTTAAALDAKRAARSTAFRCC